MFKILLLFLSYYQPHYLPFFSSKTAHHIFPFLAVPCCITTHSFDSSLCFPLLWSQCFRLCRLALCTVSHFLLLFLSHSSASEETTGKEPIETVASVSLCHTIKHSISSSLILSIQPQISLCSLFKTLKREEVFYLCWYSEKHVGRQVTIGRKGWSGNLLRTSRKSLTNAWTRGMWNETDSAHDIK